ncbi:MAG: methyltransferase domain-containing protein [Acidobacteriota bacterium]
MADANVAFAGSIPENYDRFLVPVFFAPYARDLVRRITVQENAAVLEIACGTGMVTRKLKDTLPATARLVATDLNPEMMEVAKRKFTADEIIEWQQADAMNLPFADETFDAAICQFGLMFVPDKVTALCEVKRVLKPGGIFLFSVWDAIEKNEMAQIAHETIQSFFDNDPPAFYEIPFSLDNPEGVQAFLKEAGFIDIQMDIVTMTGESPTAQDAARGTVEGNPIINAINERGVDKEKVIEAVAEKLAKQLGDKPLKTKLQALVFKVKK